MDGHEGRLSEAIVSFGSEADEDGASAPSLFLEMKRPYFAEKRTSKGALFVS